MAYCTYEPDVEKRIRSFFEPRNAPAVDTDPPATKPSLDDVNEIIEDVARRIDMHLRGRSALLPVEDEEALASLLTLNAAGAASAVLRSALKRDQGAGSAAQAFEDEFNDGLAFIDKGGLDKDTPKSGGNVADGFPRRHHCHHGYDLEDGYSWPR